MNNNKQLLREDYRHLQFEDYKIIELMKKLSKNKFKTAQDNYNNYLNADNMEKRDFYRSQWVNFVINNSDMS